jgi:hypothetical protein
VPRSLDNSAGLLAGSINNTSDVFYRIDLETGLKRLIAEPANQQGLVDVAVTEIWLDNNEQYLFFWDAKSGQIYRMRLE